MKVKTALMLLAVIGLLPGFAQACHICELEAFFQEYQQAFIAGKPDFVDRYFTAGATENGKPVADVYQTFFTDTRDRRLEIAPGPLDAEGWMGAEVTVSARFAGGQRTWSGTLPMQLVKQDGVYRIAHIVQGSAPEWKVRLQMALQGADLATTLVALSAGAVEANPLMAALGPAGFVAAKLAVMTYLWHKRRTLSERETNVMNGLNMAVVANNLGVILR